MSEKHIPLPGFSLASIRILPDPSQLRGRSNPGWLPRNRMHTIWPVQAKLAINKPGDRYEEEADRVAEQVMRMPEPRIVNRSEMAKPPLMRRSCPKCKKKASERKDEEEQLQMKPLATRASHSPQIPSSNVPPIVHEVLSSPGQPLDAATRAFMEPRFGHDFSRVRVHDEKAAHLSAREIKANAYTAGRNIVFGAGQFTPATNDGKRLIAHELMHVVQQTGELAQRSQLVQRWGSEEHVRIGSNALPGRNVLIVGYGNISYGEMSALGDYFESLQEMQRLATSWGDFGRQQIDYARWKVNQSLPRPVVSDDVIEAVEDRYNRLASRNETHFSTGSAPGRSNRERYIEAHTEAINAAYREGFMPLVIGLGYRAQEAFASHFLTDAFAAGHIRTQRGQIQAHWDGMYPNSTDNLVQTISCYMASYINDHDNIGYLATVNMLTNGIAPVIRQRGGSILRAFSIGDLISKVIHDADNAGIDVVSSRGPSGMTTPRPYRWRAAGEGSLYPSTANAAATQTQQMVEEAVRLSYQETEQAYSAGVSADSDALARLANPMSFRALALIPSEDITSLMNPAYNWRSSSISALPVDLRNLLVAQFAPNTEIRRGIDSMSVPRTYPYMSFVLSTGEAWDCFRRLLLANPFGMIQRICNGNTCPPGQNNPCP